MAYLQNVTRTGGFLQSEANGFLSRDKVTLQGGGIGELRPGTVLGRITASGKFVPSPKTGSDGSQVAAAILFDFVDVSGDDVLATIISRDAEVRASDLAYDASVTLLSDQEAKWAQLADVSIIVRE